MKETLISLFSSLKKEWPVKVISLLIAIVIWLLVVQYVNPEDTRVINNIPIQVITEESVPETAGLMLVTDYNKTLNLTYKASRDVIAVLDISEVKAYVDLSSATNSGEYNFPVKIDTGGQKIEVIDMSVTEATLKFEKIATAQVSVKVTAEGSVPDGFVKNEPVCVPSVINIQGPESVISQITTAEVNVPESNFTQTAVYNCDYTFADADGNEIDKKYITADVEKVDVNITVFQTKVLPVTANIINTSGGYESKFINLKIVPDSITVAGSAEVLDTLNSYDLGTIDITEKTESFKQEYIVTLQNGIKNVDAVSTVTIDVDFGDVRTKNIEFKNTDIVIENLPDKQKATIKEKGISIAFRGIAEDIERLKASDLKVVLDFQNKEQAKGANSVPVVVIIPEDYKIGVSGKYHLTVEIS